MWGLQAYCSTAHQASVNALSFAPHELGLALAAASSDGSISVLTHTAETGWHTEKVRCLLRSPPALLPLTLWQQLQVMACNELSVLAIFDAAEDSLLQAKLHHHVATRGVDC